MLDASISLDPAFTVAPVSRRTFGTFVEHLGRCVYEGIYEPGHPTADEDGFRGDVLALTRELGTTVVRYPGGNFVSGYRWEDGVGPVAARPTRLDLAWRSLEPNEVGLDEFVRWARKARVEPMMAVNLGTRGVQEALDVLEYANHPAGTALSDRRIANGSAEPHAIRMWCLGNEMDGPWQTGHKTASEYGRLAAETARAMRQLQPDLELVACGSSGSQMPTFGTWEATVLAECYDLVDFVSLHAYYEEGDDVASFLASAVDMDRFVDAVVATVDAVGAQVRSRKRIQLSFDEWNVWYLKAWQEQSAAGLEWRRAPRLLEDTYTVTDAVVVGSLLVSLLRHSDRVTAACLAQLVNVIAPIRCEPGGPAWRQTTFHPFALTAALARGDVLRTEIRSPEQPTARFGDVPVVDAVATHDPASGDVVVLAVNRSLDEPVRLDVDLRSFGPLTVGESHLLADPDRLATNTQDAPDRVRPRPVEVTLDDGRARVTLPPVSWLAVRLTTA
ncbi:MAG: alpha-N-arabinofuranosidase [Actinobacteria bacterium]|nr:alpha-N-arabinofuranosidase [Actinomycetota bacterium]